MTNPTRLFDFIEYQLEKFPQKTSFAGRYEGKAKNSYSTAEVVALANRTARALWRLGLRKGDKIGTITTRNRPEWVILDIAMMQIGVVNVPVYPTISASDYKYIFNDAEVKYCFIGDDAANSLAKKMQVTQPEVPTLKEIFTFDKVSHLRCWEDLWEGDTEGAKLDAEIAAVKNAIAPEELATIIYTSGTTGEPKGVMLSHHNIVSNIKSVMSLIPLEAGERTLSFLPLNHVFERVVVYAFMFYGANITFVGLENIGDDLRAVQPHFFTTVPRLLEKVYEKIYNKGLELKGIKRALFFWALGLTKDHEIGKQYSGFSALKNKIADKLIFSKWREALGGHIKGIIIGAAACPYKIAQVFCFAGIPVREGYGMTELSPGVSINRFEEEGAMLGTVGPVLDGVEVYIDTSDGDYRAGEGEILVAGPNVMMGYYQKPEATAAVIREIGGKRWLCTGDIGRFVDKKGVQMLQITDRKKELFKTSGGKYIAPAPLENKLKEHYLIEQAMIVGDDKKFVSTLLVPAVEALRDWCSHHEIKETDLAALLNHEKVRVKYESVIQKININFAKYEQIKRFELIPDTWEPVKPDGSPGELTPTMKLKRRVILDKYRSVIDKIYQS